MAFVIITNSNEEGDQRVVAIETAKPMFVGRLPACDISLPSPAVSRQHAVLIEKNGAFGIKDLGSANGTFVNGKRLQGSRKLKEGDIVQVGEFVLKVMSDAARATVIMPIPDSVVREAFAPSVPVPPPADAFAGFVQPRSDSQPRSAHPDPEPAAAAFAASPLRESAVPAEGDLPDIRGSVTETPAFQPDSEPPREDPPEPGVPDVIPQATPESERGPDEDIPLFAEDSDAGADVTEFAADLVDRDASAAFVEIEERATSLPDPVATLSREPDPVAQPESPAAASAAVTPEAGDRSPDDSTPASGDGSAVTPGKPGKEAAQHVSRPVPRSAPAKPAEAIDEDLYEPDADFIREAEAADGDELLGEAGDNAEPIAEETAKKAEAASKAAAEAGLVGEFTPDLEEEAVGQAAVPEEPAFDKIPISDGFRQAMEDRLSLYAFLGDLAKERQDFLGRVPQMPDAVKSELARQDRELLKMPGAAQARDMLEKRAAKRKALAEKIAEAKKTGNPPPKRPPKSMREAEELAETQWHFIIQSEEEAFPAVLGEAFAVVQDEPLVEALAAKDIDPKTLLGGGAYLLALESLLDETARERQDVRSVLAIASAKDDKKSGFRLFGRGGDDEDEDDDAEEGEPAPNAEELAEREQELAERVGAINKEMAELEKKLIAVFWQVYADTALAYLPGPDPVPLAVRCFLRHGAVGFKPWWMKEDVRNHVIEDCRDNYRDREAREAAETCIVYADEYLEAVLSGECTPALDENLELNERNSPAWKADKALRRIVYSHKQEQRLKELLHIMEAHLDRLREETESFDAKLAKILPGSRNEKQNRRELQQKQQGVRVETTKATKIRDKIRNETLASLQETVSDTEARFESGELPRPGTEFLIRRECDAVHRIARLLANLKERFLPLVVRDYKLGTDAMNDREAVSAEIAFMERRDPAAFLETIVPAKKRKDRVDLRVSPTIVIVPSPGLLCYAWNPRGGQENGRLAIPTCFIRQRLRERQITYLLSDFRWDTSKAAAGMDIMMSDTIVAAFMAVRWDWRKRSREAREKGLIFNDQNDRTNWRRVYESYIQTALDGGKKLYNRNYDFYERIIGKYFYLPDGVELLKK